MKMNTRVKNLWINALESKEYIQTKRKLRDKCGFCYMGVLCDLYAKEHKIEWDTIDNNFNRTDVIFDPNDSDLVNEFYFMDYEDVLPGPVMIWAGLTTDNPYLDEKTTISELNDSGYTFFQIAQLIRDHL